MEPTPAQTVTPAVWVSPAIYLAVLISAGYSALVGPAVPSVPSVAVFTVGMAALVGLDLIGRSPAGGSRAAVGLAVRCALTVLVVAVDVSGLAAALLVLVPFTAYFRFGRRTALVLSAGCLAFVVLGLAANDADWYRDPEAVSDLLMVLIGLVLAVSAAATAVGRRHALVRLEQTVSDLEDSHATLERYASRVAELSAAAERTRMARDLHDSLGHHLTAVGIQLDKAIAFRDRDPVVADRAVRDARSASALALRDARSSVRALRDGPAGGPARLGPALAELARRLEGDDLEITVEVDDAGRECSTATSHVLFRAAQEALTNVRRHARARRAGVRVSASGDGWRLVIEDDGEGFAADGIRSGWGLIGLRERVSQLGGTVEVARGADAGTRVSVAIPDRVGVGIRVGAEHE